MDHPFNEDSEEVKLRSYIKKESLDDADSLYEAIDVEVETRLRTDRDIKKESTDIVRHGTSIVKEEPVPADDDEVTSNNITDHLFKVKREGVEISSSDITKESLDETDSPHEAIYVEVETRLRTERYIKKESTDIVKHGTSIVKEEPVPADDDEVTSINITDHLFKVEREGVEMRSSDSAESSNKSYLNNHPKIQTNQNRSKIGEKLFTCDICDKSFSQKCHLSQHVIRFHTEQKPYTCNLCEKTFIRKCHLNRHMGTHTGKTLHKCDICKKNFVQKVTLNNHMKIHTGEKPFACDVCKKKFIRKCDLITHKRTHTGEKPFTCEICKKRITRKCYLDAHLRTHTGEKPYTCDTCKKSFIQKITLINHMKYHTGEKPFTCDFCDKNFFRKWHLNSHMRIHTGEKPYTCDICDRKFSQLCTLNVHMRTHTAAQK